jgi:hypothetical protein
MADSRRKSSVFHHSSAAKQNEQNRKASHSARRICAERFVGLGFAVLVFILWDGKGGVFFKPIAVTGHFKSSQPGPSQNRPR